MENTPRVPTGPVNESRIPAEARQENNAEKQVTMERAREKRFQILSNAMDRFLAGIDALPKPIKKTALVTANFTALGTFKMSKEVYKGKTMEGRILTDTERILYTLSVVAAIVAKAMAIYGMAEGTGGELGAAGLIEVGSFGLTGIAMMGEPLEKLKAAIKEKDVPGSIKNFVAKMERIKNLFGYKKMAEKSA